MRRKKGKQGFHPKLRVPQSKIVMVKAELLEAQG